MLVPIFIDAPVLPVVGHILHARSEQRASALKDMAPLAGGIVIGDLSSVDETRNLAEQVNRFGHMDAVVHNAGIYTEPERGNRRD